MKKHPACLPLLIAFFVLAFMAPGSEADAQSNRSAPTAEGLRLVNDMVRRSNSIRRFCKNIKYAQLERDDKLLARLKKLSLKYDLNRARAAWRFHPDRLAGLRTTKRKALQDMSPEARGDFGRRVLECLASGLHRDDSILKQLFADDFARAQFRQLYHPKEMRPVFSTSAEIARAIDIRRFQATEHDDFARQVHKALGAWLKTGDQGHITELFRRWEGRLERVNPYLLSSFTRMARTNDVYWLTSYLHDIRNRFGLFRFDAEAPYPDVGQKQLNWPSPKAEELIIGSHFGLRHFVSAADACANPTIKTHALALPPEQHLLDAYFASAKELRQSCGFGDKSHFSTRVNVFVAGELSATFAFSIGGRLHKGKSGAVSDLKIIRQPKVFDPVAQRFWTYPRSHAPITEALIRHASPALRGDIYYAIGTRRGGRFDIVAYSKTGGDITEGVLYGSYTDIKIRDRSAFQKAVDARVPAAIRRSIDDKFDEKSRDWRIRPSRTTIQGYVDHLRTLRHERFFKVFHGIEIAKRQGFDIKDAVLDGDREISISKVAPSAPQAYRAINAYVLDGNCGPLGYLFNPQSDLAKTDLVARAMWRRYRNGCELRHSRDGNRLFLRPEKVKSITCTGKEDAYQCNVTLGVDCGVESPFASGLTLPSQPRLAEIAKDLTCRSLKGSIELRSRPWRFVRVGDNEWTAKPLQ